MVMRPKFLQPSDLSPDQRRRLFRVLAGPILRIVLYAGFVWAGFILAVLVFTRAWRPDIDTNGLPFILAVFPVSCLVCAGAVTVGHVLWVRWLTRYRSRRRGRPAAMRWFLRPSDGSPRAGGGFGWPCMASPRRIARRSLAGRVGPAVSHNPALQPTGPAAGALTGEWSLGRPGG